MFESIDKRLYTADDLDGELPNEHIKIEIDTGGPNSNEHLNAGGQYDNYTGSIEIVIQTPRVADDQVAITKNDGEYSYIVSGAGTVAVNGDYVRVGDVNTLPYYVKYDTDGISILYHLYSAVGIGIPTPGQLWLIDDDLDGNLSLYSTGLLSPIQLTPPLTGWIVDQDDRGDEPAPTLAIAQSTPIQFKSRHAELVAITRKTLEEIDALVLSTNWPNALSPTKIKPTGTERQNDAEHRMTRLSYELQFRIA